MLAASDIFAEQLPFLDRRRPRQHAAHGGIDQLAAVVRTRLKSMQYRPGLLDAFIQETGLAIEPQPP